MPAVKISTAWSSPYATTSVTPGPQTGLFSPQSTLIGLVAMCISMLVILGIALLVTYVIRRNERSRQARQLRPLRLPSIVSDKESLAEVLDLEKLRRVSAWGRVKAFFKVRGIALSITFIVYSLS